jgi:hypothetical protein
MWAERVESPYPCNPRRARRFDRHGSIFEMNQANDVVQELEDWLAQRVRDAQLRKRSDERPEIEVDLVRRAVAEIKALRERLGLRRGTRSIAAEDLNASNDE